MEPEWSMQSLPSKYTFNVFVNRIPNDDCDDNDEVLVMYRLSNTLRFCLFAKKN